MTRGRQPGRKWENNKKKRLLGILLCLCMVLTLFPALAFAEGGEGETSVCTCETACAAGAMNTKCPVCGAEGAAPESCGKYAAPAEPTAVEQAQALIDALPAADTITAENRGGVETQLTAIDEAKAALTEEERAALDFTKYDTAIAALNALDGMGGAGTPLPADDTEELQKLLSEAPDSSTVTLDRDYTITKTLTVGNSITLDLKGHVIRMNGSDSVLEVYCGLTLEDSDPYAAHEDSSLPAGGVITGGNAGEGGGVFVDGGNFTMECGTIFGCWADRGGGVYVKEGSFTMNDGAIKGCSAQVAGGGVYAKRHFIMNGGAIEDCSAASNGQAVYITETDFIANYGTIKGTVCAADNGHIVTDAGASYARFYDQVTIESGTISAGIYYGGIAPGPEVITESYSTVSFDLGGGSGDIPKQFFVGVAGPLALMPADPTKDGYTFAGWYMDEALTIPCDFEFFPVDGNPTLYAKFEDGTKELQALLDNAPDFSKVTLTKDYTISQTLEAHHVTLDLNGHVIRMTGSGSVIKVHGALTLEDSDPEAIHPDDPSLPAGGVITGGHAAEGGGVRVERSQLIMNAGTIFGCWADTGGGVYVTEGSFTMDGGAIEDCSAASNGQAVYVENCEFTANSGTIKGTVCVADGGRIVGMTYASFAKFYDQVTIEDGSTIKGGIYYGGIAPGPEVITESYNTVSFDLGGGSGDIPKQYFVQAVGAWALKPADPTGEGYTFTGWFTDEALTTPYDFTAPVTGNLTLYAGFKPATYTVTYDPGKYGTGSIPAGTKEHGKDFILSADTFTRQGYVQTSWKSVDGDWYSLGGTYSTDANVTLYPAWDKIEAMTVPFTTTVTLGSSAAPGETVFDLELVDANGKPVSNDAVTVSGSVTTNGAGSYNGALTFAGPVSQIQLFITEEHGVFVRQVDAGAAGWTLDGRVWGVILDNVESDNTESGVAFPLIIYPVKVVDGKYVFDSNAGPVERMTFSNFFTHTHRYSQYFNDTEHWDECPCGDEQNRAPHRFGDWVITSKPTGTATGLKERKCADCDYVQTAEIPKLSPTDSPGTGDNSKLTLWLALLGVSAAGLTAAAPLGKRRKGARQ